MTRVARSYTPAQLREVAYALYERFRPNVAEGRAGWSAKGELDLDRIERTAKGHADR